MTKQDVGEFEKFAPHYFEYINGCLQKKQLTLLAKIFGVYKVVIKKKDAVLLERPVLIIENLFCEQKIVNKYDLKGSERNRLVDTTTAAGQSGETVLLDENLIKGKVKQILKLMYHNFSFVVFSILDKTSLHPFTFPNRFTRSNKSRCIVFGKKLCHGLFTFSGS